MSNILPDNVKLYPEAVEDFLSLDKGRQIKVIKALQKIARAPSQYGKPLENQDGRPLAGFRSIYVDRKSLRIIWTVAESGTIEVAVVAGIAERDGLLAYRLVASRRQKFDEFLQKLLIESLRA
ncbi:hypothetical protein Moth_0655 [Calderihabitans maritimus]|uniref:Cytotoxic translational repressor of toxin-antitoxin stability system n=2 Tax=Calderihabitans maritimus TaxID=1246530 RepID=A0A1Z5HW09_9FIRM|nr:hypothetical protein Moth_0655 [Calderihabitans maritimus]